jgi:hypothetical protein
VGFLTSKGKKAKKEEMVRVLWLLSSALFILVAIILIHAIVDLFGVEFLFFSLVFCSSSFSR